MYMCFASTSTHMIYTLSLHDALPICCGDRFARRTNSILGRLLSLALLIFLGVCSLFFGQQLCHSGLWRGSPAIKLADVGAAREHHRRIDVRNIREPSVCNSHSARQPRFAILSLVSLISPTKSDT